MDAEIWKDKMLVSFVGINLSLGSSPSCFFELCHPVSLERRPTTTLARASLEDHTSFLHQQSNPLLCAFSPNFR